VANIKGDSTILTNIEIDPQSKVICSNGLVYDYQSFSIGDSLYYGENKLEGETLCEAIGAGRFSWIDDKVKVERDRNYQPVKQEVPGFTSNDSTMFVQFDNNYEGKYTVTFEIEDLFPGTYRFVWQSNYRITGEWAIYINGEKVKEYDTYNLVNSVFSVSEDIYKFWPNERGFNKFDFWVEDLITEYGDVKIKLEYLGPGESSSNGLSIDYISLIPKKN
jgi:hypothetical protein